MAWNFTCWSCKKVTEMETKVFRSSKCEHCLSDMRACKNCSHYDTYASNECREPMAEYESNKERANFCGYFTARTDGANSDESTGIDDAKARLEALFKK